LPKAQTLYRSILRTHPQHFDSLHLLGAALIQTGQAGEGVAFIGKALRLKPGHAEAHYNLALGRQMLGDFAAALSAIETALALAPRDAEYLFESGNVLRDLNRPDEAMVRYDAALRLRPSFAEAHNNKGNALREAGHPAEAVASYDRAIGLKPGYAEAHNNRGSALKDLNRLDEALTSFNTAISLAPDDPSFARNRGHLLLLMGQFPAGLKDYEARKHAARDPSRTIKTRKPPWLGREEIRGKTILVHWEQGLGDTIQFARLVPLLAGRGAEVLFSPQRQLRRLMTSLAGPQRLVDDRDDTLAYDFHIPLLSTMLALGTGVNSIPQGVPYLAPEPQRVAFWRDAVKKTGTDLTIGICWQGGTSGVDRGRSFHVEAFLPLARLPGVRLVSLHKGAGEAQLAALPPGMRVETLAAGFDEGPDAFMDTAAVISLCDLVITSDTAVAHLAGALGARTWVALKQVPDWRWLTGREDSPWYPTMRLYRQTSAGDWASVFARMEEDLRHHLATRTLT
jgi:tetratricopeptide (TPR) repeat protein